LNEESIIITFAFFLQHYGSKKSLPTTTLNTVLANMAVYLEVVPPEALVASGTSLVQALESFFRKLVLVLPSVTQFQALTSIVASSLKIPAIGGNKVCINFPPIANKL
jgi:hypothetical protein